MRFHEIELSGRTWGGGWSMPIRVMTLAPAAIAAVAIGSALPANAQPRSAITDIDLPEGTVPCSSSGCRAPAEHEEVWRYDRPYEDVGPFFQNELGTGSRADAAEAVSDDNIASRRPERLRSSRQARANTVEERAAICRLARSHQPDKL